MNDYIDLGLKLSTESDWHHEDQAATMDDFIWNSMAIVSVKLFADRSLSAEDIRLFCAHVISRFESPNDTAKALQMTPSQVKGSLARLKSVGLVTENEMGEYIFMPTRHVYGGTMNGFSL